MLPLSIILKNFVPEDGLETYSRAQDTREREREREREVFSGLRGRRSFQVLRDKRHSEDLRLAMPLGSRFTSRTLPSNRI
jgi:hypothetical protein